MVRAVELRQMAWASGDSGRVGFPRIAVPTGLLRTVCKNRCTAWYRVQDSRGY